MTFLADLAAGVRARRALMLFLMGVGRASGLVGVAGAAFTAVVGRGTDAAAAAMVLSLVGVEPTGALDLSFVWTCDDGRVRRSEVVVMKFVSYSVR